MTNAYVVDAHALTWYLTGSARLGMNARAVMHDRSNTLYLPVIALAEACWAVEHGKSSIANLAALLGDVDADPRIQVVPLDRAILERSQSLLAISEMHDRLIVATALHLAAPPAVVPLLTCDPNITSSGLIPIVW